MEYRIKRKGHYIQADIRNGAAWVVQYSGYESEGRDLVSHWAAILESKGYLPEGRA
jgi:hypothetical protein